MLTAGLEKTWSSHRAFVWQFFGEHFPINGTGICFRTENRNGTKLYHLRNTCKVFAFNGESI